MFDSGQLRDERDNALARALTMHAQYLAMSLRDWIREECREIRPLMESLNPVLQGVVRGRLAQILERLDDIERDELSRAYNGVGARCQEIIDGDYEDPLDARLAAEETLWRLERLVRELGRMRRFYERFMSEAEP